MHPSIAKAAGAYVASYGLGLDIGAGSDSDERSWVAQSPAGYKNGISNLGLLKITNLKITKFRNFENLIIFSSKIIYFFFKIFKINFDFSRFWKFPKIDWKKNSNFSNFWFYKKKVPTLKCRNFFAIVSILKILVVPDSSGPLLCYNRTFFREVSQVTRAWSIGRSSGFSEPLAGDRGFGSDFEWIWQILGGGYRSR